MKKTIAILTAAFLLCACNSGANADISDTEPISVTETASETDISQTSVSETSDGSSASETSPQTETVTQTETETAELSVPIHTGQISVSAESGFYTEDLELEITAPEGCTIYYTEDGSDPDSTKTLYTGAILLQNRSSHENFLTNVTGTSPDNNYVPRKKCVKANVIRIAAVDENGNITDTVSHTYFVGVEIPDIPVISVITDPKNFFNREKGIYVNGDTFDEWAAEQTGDWQGWQAKGNYSNRGKAWERPATVEYITAEGAKISQNCGVRIMGAASRTAAQKSMRFIAREDYGKKNFKYPLIPGNMRSDGNGEVEKYKTFVIRNGGNDCDFAKLRDPVLQELVSSSELETMQYIPVTVFLDGEYWGMYTLTEYYGSHYIENNYSLEKGDAFDDDNVIFLKKGAIEDGEEEDIELYNEMYDFVMNNDLNNAENYKKLSKMLDIKSYADYAAFNLYIHNSDSIFEENNWAMWRVRKTDDRYEKADGRWRMMVYDTEYSSGIYDANEYKDNNLKKVMNKPLPDPVDEDGNTYRSSLAFFRRLTECEEFRKQLVNSLCDMRNICFERERASDTVLRVYDLYKDYAPATFERFGPEWVLGGGADEHFAGQVANFANFLDERYNTFPEMTETVFSEGEQSEVTVNYDETKGTVLINSKAVSSGFEGIYFTDCPFELTVISDSGSDAAIESDSRYTLIDSDGGKNTYLFEPDKKTDITVNFN